MSDTNCIRENSLTEGEMEGRVCTAPENPNVGDFGEDSWLPCMNIDLFSDAVYCKNCIYCQLKK